MAESNIFIGKQIGNYRIEREIASGGFGGVYLAQHIFLTARFVAIKMLHAIHLGSQEEREGFLQEAQWLEKLKHPYILPIYDVGIHEGIPLPHRRVCPKWFFARSPQACRLAAPASQ